ncbi:hypothetical protein ACLOJK_034084 [Asimina triloba]
MYVLLRYIKEDTKGEDRGGVGKMLTCIACAKQAEEREVGGDGARGTPSTKDAVKSLTSQRTLSHPWK